MVTAKQWLSPQAICLILIPCNALIGCGVNRSLEFPCPNLPKSPLQTNNHKISTTFFKKETQCTINHQTSNEIFPKPTVPTVHLQLRLRVGSGVMNSTGDGTIPGLVNAVYKVRSSRSSASPCPSCPSSPRPQEQRTPSDATHIRLKLKQPILRT